MSRGGLSFRNIKMDDILDDLSRISRQCEIASNLFQNEPIVSMFTNLFSVAQSLERAWSGSWIGYHSTLYIEGLRFRRPDEFFDPEWGLIGSDFISKTYGPWVEYTYEEVKDEILKRAEIKDLSSIYEAVKNARETFHQCKDELLPILDVLLSDFDDDNIRQQRDKLEKLNDHVDAQSFAKLHTPKGNFMSRDSTAMTQMFQGIRIPHHIAFDSWLSEQLSYGSRVEEIGKISKYISRYLHQKYKMKGSTLAKTEGNIFIGHGGSNLWRELAEFIQNRLRLEPDEFNRVPVAGYSNSERLEQMLNNASFAFLVMTAEDEQADKSLRARENVVHESGLFQGRLGFKRAIILLEDGYTEFSNVQGLGQIRFPKGNIKAVFEDVRQVLEREKII